jgi:transposase
MADVAVIDIDIGKTTFHLVAVDASGAIQWKKKHRRSQLMRQIETMP